MESAGQYLFGIIAAALLAGISALFFEKKDLTGKVMKVICGIILVVTIISPIKDIRIQSFQDTFLDKDLIESAVQNGKNTAKSMYTENIKQQTEEYILKKANALDAQLTVEVILSETEDATPTRVIISGSVSPYAKTSLQRIISQDLGIDKEDQVWN